MPPPKLLFLPGVGGDPTFWQPVGARLPASWSKVYLGWPGLGEQPADPSVQSVDDLVRLAAAELPAAVIAQSMGGVVAVRLALTFPTRISRLVLVATSGGVNVARLGAADWRPEYRQNFPDAAPWITDPWPDHTAEMRNIVTPTLLIWGDRDPISPVAVGKHLASLLPEARLAIVAGGSHSMAREQSAPVAALIVEHVGALAA
ncbi:MAG: alpha/beta fold hydrolase [Proteobacteria bacterium]|nr:alpha/beta fold hydrolase [Pseudomonadota bacterium]